MTNKFSSTLLIAGTVIVLLFTGCKKDDPNVAIWTLSGVQSYTVLNTSHNPLDTQFKALSLSSSVLTEIDSSEPTIKMIPIIHLYSNYSLKLNIQKGGRLTIAEKYIPSTPGVSPIEKSIDGYWNYVNKSTQNGIIQLNGMRNTIAGFASEKYQLSQTNGKLTLVYNGDATPAIYILPEPPDLFLTATTLTFTK